jgi:hypothetical protein
MGNPISVATIDRSVTFNMARYDPLLVPRKGRMLHSRCFPEHCRTSPGSPPRPRATALTKVFCVVVHTRPGRSQSPRHALSEIQGDRKWTSPRRPSSSHRRVRRHQSRRNRNPNTRLSMRRRNRVGVSRSQARRSVPLVSGIVGRGVSLCPLLMRNRVVPMLYTPPSLSVIGQPEAPPTQVLFSGRGFPSANSR